jgi:hypothetical protein
MSAGSSDPGLVPGGRGGHPTPGRYAGSRYSPHSQHIRPHLTFLEALAVIRPHPAFLAAVAAVAVIRPHPTFLAAVAVIRS